MTTLRISSAFRHIAAAFGNERAQQKLAQQKEDRTAPKLLSVKSFDPDRKLSIPPFEPALPGRTRQNLTDVTNLPKPGSVEPRVKGSTPPPQQRHVDERSRDTPDRQRRSTPTRETARVAASPSRVAARSAPANRIAAESAQQGGWLHNHWKPSAAGIAAHAGHVDTPDAPKASAAKAAPATATAREEARTVATFSGPAWMLRSTFIATPFRIPRPTTTAKAASTAAASAPAGKPTLPARTDKVLEHKEVVRTARRQQEPVIPVAPKAATPVATHTSTTPAQPKASPLMIAQPPIPIPMPMPMATTTKAPAPPPPPPPLPQNVSPKRFDTASRGVMTELKSRTLATSESLDNSATETFGTGTERTGDAPRRASLDAGRQGFNPAKAAAQILQSELAVAIEKHREKLGEKPAKKSTRDADRPTGMQPQPKAAGRTDTLIKPRAVALGPHLISKEQQKSMFEELRTTLESLKPAREI